MIHVLNFEGQIIDFISQSDSAIIRAEHNRNINEKTETFDFTILSDRTEHLQEKNRIIIEDSNRQYREFIIEHISQDIDGYTEIESTATYLEDLANAKPYGPNTLSKMTTKQALSDVLKDTGWEVSDQTEYGGIRTTSWTSYQTRYEVLLQLCTTYDMVADYYIELGNNTVEGRYVILRERNPMFNGKEITYGKDLIGLKRTVDFSEVKTALLCVGPEKEDGSRIELVVTDDEAQAEFGLPGRYSWGIYEPESDDQNMTEARLRTLGTTELNKRKSELISYEVTSTDISKVYKHEVTHLGDMVRIKNRDFTPPLYVEAEVISEQYDMIAEESTYGFGQYKEYRESDLRGEFDKKLSDIRQKMNDTFSNVNTIIQDTISGELEYYEKKIIKSDTPPENPVNDMLWYDTSNPDVAVLWRYWNGEWREHSVNDVEKIGGITREKALYSELSNTFINLSIQHSKLLNEVYEVLNSEYFVDTDLKNEVNSKLNDTIGVFNQIKTNLDSMTPETATIGKLIDTQLLFLTYRERMQALYISLEKAKIAIDERFKLLQSQYTEEKYNEAMQKVADVIGGTYDAETGQLIADIPSKVTLEEMRVTIENAMNDMSRENAAKLQELQNGITQTNQRVTSTNEELSAGITSVTKKVDGMRVGGRNILIGTDNLAKFIKLTGVKGNSTIEPLITSRTGNMYHLSNIERTSINSIMAFAFKDIAPLFGVDLDEHVLSFYMKTNNEQKLTFLSYNTETLSITPATTTDKFQKVVVKLKPKAIRGEVPHHNGNLYLTGTGLTDLWIYDIKLEKGNVATDWTPAPEDTDKQINDVKTTAQTQSADIKVLKDGILLKADGSEVTKIYDNYLTPLQTQVNQQKATLDILPSQIAAKVSQSQYTTDMNNIVGRMNTADSERTQLSNQIKDRVTLKDYKATEEKLETMETSIEQNGQQINLKASKDELNNSKKTLSRVLADLTVNTTDGLTLTYDENGSITSHVVGPNGVKIKGDKVDIQANSNFSVLVANVNNKVGYNEIINRINLSPEGLDIDVNNIGIRGGNSQDYISIRNNEMLSYGIFERSWGGQKDTAKLELGIKDGRVLIRNQNTGYRLYLTERGLSTMMDGFSDDTSGTLEFHSKRFNETSRGITMHSTYGAVALLSEQSRIYSRSRLTNNIESFDYGVYIRPYMNSRPGVNEFNFYIKDNDGAVNTDGCLLFGEVSDDNGLAGSGIRFKKAGVRGYENMESVVYATDNQGNIGTGSFYANKLYGDWKAKTNNLYALVNGEFRVTDFNGATGTNGSINYAPVRIGEINSYGSYANHSGNNVYFGVGLNELRVTNNNHYNGGNIGYKPVRAADFLKASSVKYKEHIKVWEYDALNVISNELKLYSYKYKEDERGLIQHGPVIGDGYDTPSEFIFGDGINTNEMLSWALRAIQQLNEKIKILEEKSI